MPTSNTFDGLPESKKKDIAKFLATPDLVNLCLVNKAYFKFFKSMTDDQQLLHNVPRGKHELIAAILKKNSHSILKRGNIRDCSGREFCNITAFEYAVWALDKHMWSLIISSIPENNESIGLLEALIAQYTQLKQSGVTYRLDGKIITETHFSLNNTIIKAIKTYIEALKTQNCGTLSCDVFNKLWVEGIGGNQKLLPVHVVHEYCSNVFFVPQPDFIDKPSALTQFFNAITGKNESWFSSKLGTDIAIWKGNGYKSTGCGKGNAYHLMGLAFGLEHDLVALECLNTTRLNDFTSLESVLENKLMLCWGQQSVNRLE